MVNSRDKGARGEREFSRVCQSEGFDVRRGQQFNGLEGEDVVGLPGIHVEVKRVERLNIHDAMEQSRRDARDDQLPIVAHRKDKHKWLVTMDVETFFRMYRESDLM